MKTNILFELSITLTNNEFKKLVNMKNLELLIYYLYDNNDALLS